MNYGYVRTSTGKQETIRQQNMMKELGIKAIVSECSSGKNIKDRPKFKALLTLMTEGDTLCVESISRIARNTFDFLTIQKDLQERGINIYSKKENFDTSNVYGQFAMQVFASLYEMERKMMLDRQREGIAAKIANGYKFGRPKAKFDEELFNDLVQQNIYKEITSEKAAADLGVSLSTFNRLKKQYMENKKLADSLKDENE